MQENKKTTEREGKKRYRKKASQGDRGKRTKLNRTHTTPTPKKSESIVPSGGSAAEIERSQKNKRGGNSGI